MSGPTSSRRLGHVAVALLVAAVVCIGSAMWTLGAQQGTSFRSGIDVVQIDVSVLDDKRRPVRGLTADDFTVLEDGQPREIVAFTAVDLPPRVAAASATRAPWTRDVAPDVTTNDLPAEGRLVAIVFDWSIRFMDSATARRIAIETVDNLGPGDQAAVIFSSPFANAGTPQNFTSDRARLIEAINKPFAFAMEGDDVILPARGGFINSNGVLIADPQGYMSGDCRCRVCSLDAMTRVADAVRPATGRRKLMIFIGTHFRAYESAMPAPRGDITRIRPLFPSVSSQGPPLPDALGPGSCSQPLKEARQRMERAAGLANLTIHVVDPVGLETRQNSPLGGASTESILTRQSDLHLPADLTGGRTVLNTNAPEALLPAILDESQAYYLIGFSASSAPADRLREVEVRVNRPNVHVQSRDGYYGREEAATARATGPNAPLMQAVEGVLPRTDLSMSIVAAPFRTPGKSTGTVAIVLGAEMNLDSDDTAGAASGAGRSGRRDEVQVVLAALDPRARMIASREQTIAVISNPDGSGERGYELLSRLELKPGQYEIRAASTSSTGERGSVFSFVEVPDFDREQLSLSGLVLSSDPAVRSAPPGAFRDLMPLVPTARRVFGRGDRAIAFLRLHQGTDRPGPVTVAAALVDIMGATAFEDARRFTPDQFVGSRSADYSLELPLDRLTAGEYLLKIEAAAGEHHRERQLRLTVQ